MIAYPERPEFPLDCAVDAFARTFSIPCDRPRTTLSTTRRRFPSKNLPVELLLSIFGFAYNDVSGNPDDLSDSTTGMVCPEHLDEWTERDLTSSSLFPYAPASVCSLWRDTMSLVPKFWRRIIILVDAPATPFSAVVSQLAWSRDRHLEVIVTRHAFHEPVDPHHERSNVGAIMKILLPHIHRIEKLRFNVVFSSSLPSFPIDFHGTAAIMDRLELQCIEDDGCADYTEPVTTLTEKEGVKFPELTSLVIDGRNYYEACRRDTRWTNEIASVCSLTVSHFKPRPGESFTTDEFLRPLAALQNPEVVRITDLVLLPSHEPLRPIGQLQHVSFLTLEDLHDTQAIDEILIIVGAWLRLSFIRCSLGDITGPFHGGFGDQGTLILKEINQDLIPLFEYWNGLILLVINCPRFDDSVLDMMGSTEDGSFTCAQFARGLNIRDCPNVSFTALRRLVQSRLHLPSDFGDPFDPIPTRFRGLHITGNVPLLSEQDRAWFMANVPDFFYSR